MCIRDRMSSSPPPPRPTPQGEIPWEEASDVIGYILSIVIGLLVLLVALGVRRQRLAAQAIKAAKAAREARDNPPGVVPKRDLLAVEKAAKVLGEDTAPFLATLLSCGVLEQLSKPCTDGAVKAVKKALGARVVWPDEPASVAAAGALLYAHLRADELPAKGVWPRAVKDACEYAREAVVEASIRLTRHAFDASCKDGSLVAAQSLLRLLACERLGLHSWTDPACLAAMDARLEANGLPRPQLKASCSASSWMGARHTFGQVVLTCVG